MGTTETVQIDLELVEDLTERETEKLEGIHAKSLAFREEARKHLAAGVPSSWQEWPPHPTFVDHGLGSKVWDIDGNGYVDLHNGYGVMVMGHAHPKIVETIRKQAGLGTHFALATPDSYACAEAMAERFRLPIWRFGNSGTEATLDACRIMRAVTGRDKLLKIEGSYHGHHDSLMVSLFPLADDAGPRDHPTPVPATLGLPKEFVDLIVLVPFNDAAAVERAFQEHPGEIAGMIMEPAMSNCGVVLPDPGYLQAVKDICHRNGALLTFDEVKTGATLAYGGGIEAFGVTPDLACFAKAIGAGIPCGAIGGTEEAMGMIMRHELEQVGTFNGNPLTMAVMKTNLTEVLTRESYERFDTLNGMLHDQIEPIVERYNLPVSLKTMGAKGSIDWRREPIHEYRDLWDIDDRVPQLAWLWQLNRGVFKSPGSKWESWTTSIVHSDEDIQRYIDNFEEFAAAITA